jgi:integration host factor subunit alpha
MTLTKDDLIESVLKQVRVKDDTRKAQQALFPELEYKSMSRKRSTEIVESIFEIIKGTLERGEDVLITGFGKFQVKFKWARKGRNPVTGDAIILNSRRVVTFKYANKLRAKINEKKKD